MKKDTISVAIATYNGEKYLRDQLESLYCQTRVPDEVVVSDDCSTDGTIEILEEYKEKYGLKYIAHDNNLGVNKNFEAAIRACKCDYIAICDQDDIWFPNKIKESYNKIKEIEDGITPIVVSSQTYHINGEGKLISTSRHIIKDSSKAVSTLLFPPGVTQGCTLMFNRQLLDLLKPFPKSEIVLYDSYIGMTCASIGKKYNMSQPLMYYRHHSNNAVASNLLKKDSTIRKIKDYIKCYFNPVSISKERLRLFSIIKREYGSLFTTEIQVLYAKINEYSNSQSKIRKICLVWRFKDLCVCRKAAWSIGLLFNK